MDKRFIKEEIERMILVDKISYREIGRHYSVSDAYIKKVAKALGIILPVRNRVNSIKTPHNKGKRKNSNCKNCDVQIISTHSKQIFCSQECSSEFSVKIAYQSYLENQEKFANKVANMAFIKKHLLKEQNHQCKICSIEDTWNKKPLTFVLDHIDGNAANNTKNNLRLICSNCDSQLDTFKRRNKNSARKERYLKNYKVAQLGIEPKS